MAINAYYHCASSILPFILGILSVFFIGYLSYLKNLSLDELAIPPWNVLSGKGFLQRNLRFFLFEEAQWYLIVSLSLFFLSPITALFIMAITQGILAVIQTGRIFILASKAVD